MSYGKIHRAFFDSSINDADPMARLVFIGLIVLSDREGRIDLTTEALARRLNLDLDLVRAAIVTLSSPDEASRTPDHDGRRIVPIDPRRQWGWIVVNKAEYRKSDSDDEAARADARERKRRQRERDRKSSSFTKEEENQKNTYTLRDSHAEVTSGHAVSQKKRDAIFERCWQMVPKKVGRKTALKHFNAEVRQVLPVNGTPEQIDAALDRLEADLVQAIRNYTESVAGKQDQYVKHGDSLFYNFRDFVDRRDTSRAKVRPEGLQGVAL